jgi:hypothetical protein
MYPVIRPNACHGQFEPDVRGYDMSCSVDMRESLTKEESRDASVCWAISCRVPFCVFGHRAGIATAPLGTCASLTSGLSRTRQGHVRGKCQPFS